MDDDKYNMRKIIAIRAAIDEFAGTLKPLTDDGMAKFAKDKQEKNIEHTPGPWVADIKYRDGCFSKSGELLCDIRDAVILAGPGYTIGEVISCENFDQNVNLIVAAPEMLAVLEGAEKYLTMSGYDKVEDCEPEYQMLMSFRAAIKKARGE